jgi:predicted nucleic acid-binding protein
MKKEAVFLDANILFSVAYGSVGLNHFWELQTKGVCTLLASRYVINEAERNLETRAHMEKLNSCISRVKVVTETDPDLTCPIDLPEKDVPVLMAAVSASADFLITGDITHFGAYFGQTVMGVQILPPRDYLLPRMTQKWFSDPKNR